MFAFTVDVPIPDDLRDLLLSTFFATDVKTPSEHGYFLRLHKEQAHGDSDVGLVIMRGPSEESLRAPEIDTIIRSYSTYE